MIKLTVVARDKGDNIKTSVEGVINSRGDLLVYEMAHVLEEFEKINNGETLDRAFRLLLEKLEGEINE